MSTFLHRGAHSSYTIVAPSPTPSETTSEHGGGSSTPASTSNSPMSMLIQHQQQQQAHASSSSTHGITSSPGQSTHRINVLEYVTSAVSPVPVVVRKISPRKHSDPEIPSDLTERVRGSGDTTTLLARGKITSFLSTLPACPPFLSFILFFLRYAILCIFLLCVSLLYTPLGHQGLHISNQPQENQMYALSQWRLYSERMKRTTQTSSASLELLSTPSSPESASLLPAVDISPHPSTSLAFNHLSSWKEMIVPPLPDLDEDVPVSAPNDVRASLLPQIPIDPNYDTNKPNYALGNFALVTFASSVYYQRVLNLIGSVHVWEPTQHLIIYDLGFTQEQVIELQCMENIELRPFMFDKYPKHVRNLFQYYFKPLLVYDSLQHPGVDSVLVLDSGIEIRQQLRGIKKILQRDGYFLAQQPNTIGHKSADESFHQLGVSKDPYNEIQFCAGGMFGFIKNSPSYTLIVEQAAKCALKPSCYSPTGSGRENHNFDQSINSILTYKYGMHCTPDRIYREMEMSRCPIHYNRFVPETDGGTVLCIRRWHQPKPYVEKVKVNEKCRSFMNEEVKTTVDAATIESSVNVLSSTPSSTIPTSKPQPLLNKDLSINWLYTVQDNGLIEHTQGSHQSGGSPMSECLRKNNNNRSACSVEIAEHRAGMTKKKKWMIFHSQIDYCRALLFAGLRMPLSYVLFAMIWYGMLRRSYGTVWMKQYRMKLIGGWCAFWLTAFALVQMIDAKFDK